MNIDNVSGEELWPKAIEFYGTDNPLQIIFARQRELMEKYLVIEAEILGEELVTVPVDIHSARGQRTLKERIWWTVEELVEASDALAEANDTKFLEEMSDALHFLTELWILAGLDFSIIDPQFATFDLGKSERPEEIDLFVMRIIQSLGRAGWQLRNKSWKRSQVLTDVPEFTKHMQQAYRRVLFLLRDHYQLNMKDTCILYLKKSEVNKFRLRSQY